jgi:glycosyltransferase involved in cell wall biosynthesis
VRVAYFSEAIPPLADGVTRTLTQLVGTLDAEGVAYRFYSGVDPDPGLGWRHRVVRLPSLPFPAYDYYRFALPFLHRLDADLDRFRPDVLHAVNPTLLGLWALGYADRKRIPIVSSFHTDFISYFRYYGIGMLEELGWRYLAWFYNRCDVTYAPSATTAATLGARGIEPVELWERGIDRSRFSPEHRDEALRRAVSPDGDPIMLYVGRLVREKDLADLAAATEVLTGRGQRFRLVLVGSGPMESELRARLPTAHFAGYQEGEALSRWYASADLFVFPSTTETFGNVLLEACASGLPVVAAAQGGVQDLVRRGRNGMLVEPHDIEGLAHAAEAILRNADYAAELRRGALATARRYDWTAVNRRLLESYARVSLRRAA